MKDFVKNIAEHIYSVDENCYMAYANKNGKGYRISTNTTLNDDYELHWSVIDKSNNAAGCISLDSDEYEYLRDCMRDQRDKQNIEFVELFSQKGIELVEYLI